MTSIGKFEFPEMTVTEAVEVVEGVKREKAQTTSGLAKVMGLTNPTTGFFYNKLAALSKHFGLIERDKTNISLSPLAKRIVYPVSEIDRKAAIREVSARVPLLRSLYEELGPDYHELDFPIKLLALTGAPHEDVEAKGPRIEKLYRDAVTYLRAGELAPPGPTTGTEAVGGMTATPQGSGAGPESIAPKVLPPAESGYRTFESDGVYLKIKMDPEALEEAIATIRGWQTRHRKRKSRGK